MFLKSKILLGTALVSASFAFAGSAQAQAVCDTDGVDMVQADDPRSDPIDDLNTACGEQTVAIGQGNTSVGFQTNTIGNQNTAVGFGAKAEGGSRYADEDNDNYLTDGHAGNLAVGNGAIATGNEAANVALGSGSNAGGNGSNNIAIGAGAAAFGEGNARIAIGSGAAAQGSSTMALGWDAQAIAAGSVALGYGTQANHSGSVAVGNGSITSGDNTVAFGNDGLNRRLTNVAAGTGQNDAVNLGQMNAAISASGNPYIRVNSAGTGADATGTEAVAIGSNARATAANSVALGQGALADRANSVSVGAAGAERQITHVAAGVQGSDAVNVAQLRVVEAKADAAQTTANTALLVATQGVDDASAAQATANAAVANAAAAQDTADMAVADNVRQDGELDAVRTANTRQDGELDAIRTVNTRQDGEIAIAQATADTAIVRSDTLGASTAAALGGGAAYDDATGAISTPSYTIGGQSYGNVGAAFDAVDDRLMQVDTRIDVLSAATDRGFRRANGGIAAAMALGGTMIVPDSTVSVSFNLATYRGEQGFSGTVAVRAAPRVYISGGFAGSTVKGSTGGRVGVAFGF